MMNKKTREGAVRKAHNRFDDGSFLDELERRVAIPTESQVPELTSELHRYQRDEMVPCLKAFGFETKVIENPIENRGPALIASRMENETLPTVLIYGHGDVVRSVRAEWSEGLDPYKISIMGDKIYGRGVADNKGQHTLALNALGAVLDERDGKLGFNAKFIIETGEEQGSPGLQKIIENNADFLKCDIFLGFDGPRKSSKCMDLNLGCRGGIFFDLIVDHERPGAMHSGHWGGVLPDAGIQLAHAIASITDMRGRITIQEWLPTQVPEQVSEACKRLVVDQETDTQEPDPGWGHPDLSVHEKTLAWTSFTVLAFKTGNPENPVNAVPSYAKARCQVRYTIDVDRNVFIPALRRHLDKIGLKHIEINTSIGRDQFPASRTNPDHPWVKWVMNSIQKTTNVTPNVLPCSSGSNPSELFKSRLKTPVIWIPHSYSGCNQHGPDEHGLKSFLREGLGVTAGIFWDLGEGSTPQINTENIYRV